jgi:hypothetical protein
MQVGGGLIHLLLIIALITFLAFVLEVAAQRFSFSEPRD